MKKNNKINLIKLSIRRTLYILFFLIDKYMLRRNSNIFILCYHSFAKDTWRFSIDLKILEKQLNYLISNYSAITLKDLDLYIEGKAEINKPSFIIAIDDGYQDIIKSRDLFKKLNIKPAIFLLSDTKNVSREELDTDRKFLSKEEALELYKDGWIIGSHGATHSDFNSLNDEEINEEVINSKKDLEKKLGIKIKYFAYPKGRYTTKVLDTIKEADYSLGLSMNDGIINKQVNKLLIPRVGVDKTHSFAEFKSIFMPSSISFRKFVKEKIGVIV